MPYTEPTFSVNTYDRDGDLGEEGVFLHFGVVSVKVSESIEGFRHFRNYLATMEKEIVENWA